MDAEDVEGTIEAFREIAGDRAAQALATLLAFGPNIAAFIEPDERVRNTALQAYEIHVSGMELPTRDNLLEELTDDGWHQSGQDCLDYASCDGWHEAGSDCYDAVSQDGSWHDTGDECLDYARGCDWHSDEDCEDVMEGNGWCSPSASIREVVVQRLGSDGAMLIDDSIIALQEIHEQHDEKFSAAHCPMCHSIYELINAF